MNGANGYSYLGQQTSGEENQVTFYNSICFVLNDEERAKLGKEPLDANGDGTVTIDELAGKDVIRQGQTSGAGYLYPSFFLSNLKNQANRDIWMSKDYAKIITDTKTLNEKGMTFVEGNADASKGQIHGVNTDGGYDAAFNQVMSGGADAAFGFMDIRYTQGYSKSTSDYYQDKDLFKKTQTVCMTTPIYNDTISYRTNLDAKTVETVKNAFISASKDGSKDEEGTGAYLLYKIYSHTGYKTASKEDYADEVEMYKWKVANGI